MSYKVSKKEKSSPNEDFGEVCGGEYRKIICDLPDAIGTLCQ
jgi:hypothetical protein